jgi:hypothetical protein
VRETRSPRTRAAVARQLFASSRCLKPFMAARPASPCFRDRTRPLAARSSSRSAGAASSRSTDPASSRSASAASSRSTDPASSRSTGPASLRSTGPASLRSTGPASLRSRDPASLRSTASAGTRSAPSANRGGDAGWEMRSGRGPMEQSRSRLCLPSASRTGRAKDTDPGLMGTEAIEMGHCRLELASRALGRRPRQRAPRHSTPPCSSPNLHPEDYVSNINFDKWLDLVRFYDLSTTSPTGFRTQTLLTGFGLTCHARRVRAHRRVALASIGFVRITCPRSPPRHDQLTPFACVGWTRMASLEDTSSLARSTRRRPLSTRSSARAERRADPTKTLTEDVRWLLRGSISKKADGGCTSSSSGRSSRSA